MKPWLRRLWKPEGVIALAAAIAAGCGSGDADSAPPPSVATACSDKTGPAGSFVRTIESSGRERTYRLAVPTGIDPTAPTALVLNFHGLGSNATEQEVYGSMTTKAAEEGFITAAGEGIGSSWNAGRVCCGPANQEGIDDVQFARDMVAAIAEDYCIDPARIYATGMSNGGFMSNRLACEAADLIAAVAPVASFLGFNGCAPSRPVPILMFNGTDDFLVPYTAAQGSYGAWGELNGCAGEPAETFASGDSSCVAFAGCADGATTAFCTVAGGGHTWPGGIPIARLGHTTTDLDATDAMWEFFVAHPKP
jgi:polyhydroxybutyrate depolymerase